MMVPPLNQHQHHTQDLDVDMGLADEPTFQTPRSAARCLHVSSTIMVIVLGLII